MTFEDLEEARTVFSLAESATLQEIKNRHRALVKRHHPDAAGSENERIRQINAAYQLLLNYCHNYRYSFSREEFLAQFPEERIRHQFSNDPIWGD